MESSRIFIRGLPPTITEEDFKKHFGSKWDITDSRLFAQRRIGYVGYNTPEDAAKAVKYYNRTFIRMSKIAVELARPIQDVAPKKSAPLSGANGQAIHGGPTARRVDASAELAQSLKRKRDAPAEEVQDPKLQEFLQVMQAPSKMKGLKGQAQDVLASATEEEKPMVIDQEGESDSEYETISKKTKRVKPEPPVQVQTEVETVDQDTPAGGQSEDAITAETADPDLPKDTAVSDSDWLRSRTSRLLGLTEDDDEEVTSRAQREESFADFEEEEPKKGGAGDNHDQMQVDNVSPVPDDTAAAADTAAADEEEVIDEAEAKIRDSQRLYLRNLSYSVTEDALREQFGSYGELLEVHIPMDNKASKPKGFAYLQFAEADPAVHAFREMDGKVFQGRLLHILPAAAKRETQLDDFALSKLPLKKQQQIKRRREAASSTFNWNALYMNADAVMSSVADRLGISKAELLDPTSSDAGVKQAHAETHIIQETKAYFKDNGVDLDAFKGHQRGDTAILVKNIPYDAKADELRRLFEEHGNLTRFLLPPTGTIAMVEFETAPQARAAFASLAYRKIKNSVLFLEKAPKNVFTTAPKDPSAPSLTENTFAKDAKLSTSDLLAADPADAAPAETGTATLFVRNLNFSTTTDKLTETFRPLDGFMSARVKTKTDPKKPGQVLSMGFGFLEFRSKAQAEAALRAMDGYSLEGHKLQIRTSHKATDAGEERRKEDKARKAAGRRTKIIIKNLPFETNKKDVRALFSAYGQLRSVRVPKKFDRAARGFAFAEFTTPKEAESAMDALKDTHLLGRRLVLDFAEEDPEDAEAEIEKMQKKVGSQINKVALQKLTGAGRKKFNVGGNDEMDEA